MRRLTLLAAVALAVGETYRRGYAGVVLFGCRQWYAARPDRYFEPDYMA